MNLFIFLIISLCCTLKVVFSSYLNLSVVGGITAYLLNGRSTHKEYNTKLFDITIPADNGVEINDIKFERFLTPASFLNYTKQFYNNTLNGAINVINNGSEYYNTIAILTKLLPEIAKNNTLLKLLNVPFTSISRKGSGGDIVEENKEVFHKIVDSCRDLIRTNVIEMESTERKRLLSKINGFTQTQYDKICKEFNYCRTIYQWTRLGKEITINVGRLQTKNLIEFYENFYLFYLSRLNVSGIMTPEQEELMKNKTFKLGLEPGYALRHLSHYATDIFDRNVTKYYNFSVHIDSNDLDRYTYDEWDNLNEDLMAWGKSLRNDLRSLLQRMALLTQIFMKSWKSDVVSFIRDDMVEIFKPDNFTI